MKLVGHSIVVLVLGLGSGMILGGEPTQSPSSPSQAPVTTVAAARDIFVGALKLEGKERIAELNRAYKILEEAASASAELSPARTMWAKLLLAAGDQKGARSALERATMEHPSDPEAYAMLANQAAVSGRLVESELAYAEALRLVEQWRDDHPRRVTLLSQIASGRAAIAQARAAMLDQSGQAELAQEYRSIALKSLRQWVAVAADNATAHERLALALLQVGEIDAAIESFETARGLNPALPITDLRLATTFFAQNDQPAALARLQSALESNPKDPTVQLVAGRLMLSMGDTEAAQKHIHNVLETDKENVRARLLQAQVNRAEGDWTAAAETLQKLHSEHPADFETANLLAQTLAEIDSPEARRRAVALATVTAQRFKDLSTWPARRAYLTLTWVAKANGQTELAASSLKQLLAAGINSSKVSGDEAYLLAQLLHEAGRPEIASPLLANVLARSEKFPKRAAAEQLLAKLK